MLLLKKSITVGIIITAIIIGLGVGLFSSLSNSNPSPESVVVEAENPQTSGRNITIELTEGIPISATP